MMILCIFFLVGSGAFHEFETDLEPQPTAVQDQLKACQEKLQLVKESLKAANLGRFIFIDLIK